MAARNQPVSNLTEIRSLIISEHFSEALGLLNDLELSGPVHPEAFLLKYFCLYGLNDDSVGIQDLQTALESALGADPNYVPALLECGYFQLNVQDDAASAKVHFAHAAKLARESFEEAVVGTARCIAELESSEASRSFIESTIGEFTKRMFGKQQL